MTPVWSNLGLFGSIIALFYLFDREITGSPIIIERSDYLASCPKFVSRNEWKARNATLPYKLLDYTPTPYIVIHHGGILHYCYDKLECSEIVRSYQNLHIDDRGWIDIGYNFVIGEDGNVYEGRGWDYVGAHSPGYNTQSIGISIVGDFSHFIPNSPALEALESLIGCGVELGKVSSDYRIIGHRQARNTVCPGEVFYHWVQKMPGWTDRPIPIYQNDTNSSSSSPNNGEFVKIQGHIINDANSPIVQLA